jgi:Flp pilus assembly protein TadB
VNRRGNLRASDEDRERIVERLHRAATEGRISSEELEHRTSAALKAQTYAELEATVADLPRFDRQRAVPTRRSSAGWALSTVRQYPLLLVVAIPVLAVATAMLLAATIVWTMLVLVVLMVGGRHRMARPPWRYSRYGFGPPRGRPRGHWL